MTRQEPPIIEARPAPRLLLLRHAKSSWDDPDLADFDRPLSPRGIRASATMGRYMLAEGLMPDRIICSAARRTRDTWALLAEQWPHMPKTVFERSIYEAEPAAIRAAIARHGGDARRLMVIGHNPGLEDLSRWLTGADANGAMARLQEKFPTGALAVFDLPAATGHAEAATPWDQLRQWSHGGQGSRGRQGTCQEADMGAYQGACQLALFQRPRDLEPA